MKKQLAVLPPPLAALLQGADHVDVKTIATDGCMRSFIAGMLSYYPAWLRFLYGVRWGFVRLLGMKQESVPMGRPLTANDISLTPGERAAFFQVVAAEDEKYWIAEASDRHLAAFVAVVVDRSSDQQQFQVATVVKYRHWTGSIYFNVIRPFHHIVVRQMIRAGIRYQTEMNEAI